MATPRFKQIVLFGPPGVGKGAQAEILSRRFALTHLSTGELIREEIRHASPLGSRVQEAVDRGEFADDDTVLTIIIQHIDRPELQGGFVMDGFPRNLSQALRLDEVLKVRGKKLECALFFEAPEDVILARLSGRRICSKCGATYHKEFHRPRIHGICDFCQSQVIRRKDDTPEAHVVRLKTYQEKTRPLFDYYQRAGILYRIDADQSIQKIASDICEILNAPE